MTRTKQRIAIAEFCGYKKAHSRKNYPQAWGKGSTRLNSPRLFFYRGKDPEEDDCLKLGWPEEFHPTYINWTSVPDYPVDIGAVHGAIGLLSEPQQKRFVEELRRLVRPKKLTIHLIQAAAAIKAEALLKTLSLWKDD